MPQPVSTKNTGSTLDSEKLVPIALEDRRTPELVFGVVGPIGSGVSCSAKILKRLLEEQYDYEVNIVKASDQIKANADKVGQEFDSNVTPEDKTSSLQDIGNELRKKFSDNYVIEKCIESIARERRDRGFRETESGDSIPITRRKAHIIDSLKHPAEFRLLKNVYGDVFWLLAVFAPQNVRKGRLERDGFSSDYLDQLFSRDESEGLSFGQRVRDTTELADFFLRNDKSNDDQLEKVLTRYLEILFNSTIRTPNQSESAMYKAAAAATQSACLSRQVGAAIFSSAGELLGIGCNDVPKSNGGLYKSDDENCDHRCYKWMNKECLNEKKKDALYKDLYDKLKSAEMVSTKVEFETFKDEVKKTDIKNLIEYSRSVHAEMEAIISVARSGTGELKGATLYSTTYPCHSCARHIVASGITKVVYIEPYPKSLATELHSDSITTSGDADSLVQFLQYEGVAPKNVIRLFGHRTERKRQGKAVVVVKKDAHPITHPSIDDFTRHEQLVVADLAERENAESVERTG